MNPNAPEHQPRVARDVVIIKAGSEKMFSDIDVVIAEMINKRILAVDDLKVTRQVIANVNRGRSIPIPEFPLLTVTPSPSESNVGTSLRINHYEGLRVFDLTAGTPSKCTVAYLQFISDFANQWHTKLTGVDCRSPGTNPKFFSLGKSFHTDLMNNTPQSMAAKISVIISPEQFLNLRYLFIPISFSPVGDSFHVALCAISPEARTVDYLCSDGDSGLPSWPRLDGSKCIPAIFAWLAEYLGSERGEQFLWWEWKLRTDGAKQQIPNHGDCGVYTVTHAMCLAFGYGLDNTRGGFPTDHRTLQRREFRRKRYAQDLMNGGFAFFDPDNASQNWQYYPLLDRKPRASKSKGFFDLPPEVMKNLPARYAHKRICYLECPSKLSLLRHCRRNGRFYPGHDAANVSGSRIPLQKFVEWVEEMDHMRRTKRYIKGRKHLQYPQYKPLRWIDPRDYNAHVEPRQALW